MQEQSKSQFIFPEVYQSYRELPVEVRKEWSGRYKDGLGGDLAERGSPACLAAVQGCQQPERPIDPDRLTDLIPRLIKAPGLPTARPTTCGELSARTWRPVGLTSWPPRSWRGTPARR